jgi:ribosome assembly protein YihI (activator of Der GTPase)
MRWTETLPNEGREVVDECLDQLSPRSWVQRRNTVEEKVNSARETAQPIAGASQAARVETARFMSGAIVATIIEKLDNPEIVDAEQAQFFAMSANLDDQVAACDWLIQECKPARRLDATPRLGRIAH